MTEELKPTEYTAEEFAKTENAGPVCVMGARKPEDITEALRLISESAQEYCKKNDMQNASFCLMISPLPEDDSIDN